MTPTIDVRVYSAADPTELVATLENTRKRQWRDVLNDVGSGRFEVSARHPKLVADPSILDYGNVVKFAIDGDEVFAFLIEKKTTVRIGANEDADRWISVEGRGVLALLESAVVYPEGGLGGPAEREWTDRTVGFVMRTLLNEATARGALPGVTWNFLDAADSGGNAYTVSSLDLSERVGTDLLAVAQRHVEFGVDVYMTPELGLRYWNLRTNALNLGPAPVVLRLGDQTMSLDVDGDAVIKNTLLIQGPSGFSDRQDADSVTDHGRREGFLALGNARSAGQITRTADKLLSTTAVPAELVRLRTRWGETARPYVDYTVGDSLLAPTTDSDAVAQRVHSITIEEDDDGKVMVTPELATSRQEFEMRLLRWLKQWSSGTLGGTAASVASPTASAESSAAIASAIAAHEASYPHPDELADLADIDLAGVGDEDLLQYDADSGNWEARAGILRASAPWDPGSLANDTLASTDVACPGARPGMPVSAAFDEVTAGGWMVYGNIVVADTVRVYLWNRTGGTVDLPSGALRVVVFTN